MNDRGHHLDALLESSGVELATCPTEPLPRYASIVGPPDDDPMVFLHKTTLRPCPWEWAWMAVYDLDTGWRL